MKNPWHLWKLFPGKHVKSYNHVPVLLLQCLWKLCNFTQCSHAEFIHEIFLKKAFNHFILKLILQRNDYGAFKETPIICCYIISDRNNSLGDQLFLEFHQKTAFKLS